MPATVRRVLVSAGDAVKRGDSLVILEARRWSCRSGPPRAGIVTRGALPRGRARPARRRAHRDRRVTRSRTRHHRRSRPARRPAERGRRGLDRRQDRVRRPAVGRRPAGDRSVGVRQPEVGAADGGRGRGLRRHHAAAGRRATRRSCRTSPGLERAHAAGVTEVAIFAAASETFSRQQHQSDDRRVARHLPRRLRARARASGSACAATSRRRSAVRSRATCRRHASPRSRRRSSRWARSRSRSATRSASRIPDRCRDVVGAVAARVPLDEDRAALPRHARHRARQRPRRRSTSASRRSTRRPAASAAARMRPARPATSRPKISSTCSTVSASRPASISTRSSTRRVHRAARRAPPALALLSRASGGQAVRIRAAWRSRASSRAVRARASGMHGFSSTRVQPTSRARCSCARPPWPLRQMTGTCRVDIIAAHLANQLEAVDAGQREVRDDERRHARLEKRERFLPSPAWTTSNDSPETPRTSGGCLRSLRR